MTYVPNFYQQKGNPWDDNPRSAYEDEKPTPKPVDTSNMKEISIDQGFGPCSDHKCSFLVETYRGDYPILFCKYEGECTKPSKVLWKDREVLKINELYVEGYGWITEEQYQHIMYNVDKSPATMPNRISQRNIQYQLADGKTGQMDINEKTFWENRVFIPAIGGTK